MPESRMEKPAQFSAFHGKSSGLQNGDPFLDVILSTNLDSYETTKRIGTGATGNVYQAIAKSDGSHVAVKILGENSDKRYSLVERFFVEANAATKTNHPNVIKVLDIGTYRDKIFCVMEYLDGSDLAQMIEKNRTLPWRRSLEIMAQVCDAIEAVHRNSILHRDLKPGNVFVVEGEGSDFVKVLDFGFAKFTNSDEKLTQVGLTLGTLSYIAPEQVFAKVEGKEYDHRVDIYSMGIILYEMMTGTPPFSTDDPNPENRQIQMVMMHKDRKPQPPRERNPGAGIPERVEDVVLKAIEKDPAGRFQTAIEMRDAILDCLEEDGPQEGKAVPAASPETIPDTLSSPENEAQETGIANRDPSEDHESKVSTKLEEMLGGRPVEGASGFRWVKRMVIAGIIGSAAFMGYSYRQQIKEYLGYTSGSAESEKPAPQPHQQVQQVQTSYEIRVETEPRGADVFEETQGGNRVLIGTTPLRRSVQMGPHRLTIRRRGYEQSSVILSPEDPSIRVILRRPFRPQKAAETPETGPEPAASSEPPAEIPLQDE
jgi:serine/threonine protein kinase